MTLKREIRPTGNGIHAESNINNNSINRWKKLVVVGGFMFFLIKGLLWLVLFFGISRLFN